MHNLFSASFFFKGVEIIGREAIEKYGVGLFSKMGMLSPNGPPITVTLIQPQNTIIVFVFL